MPTKNIDHKKKIIDECQHFMRRVFLKIDSLHFCHNKNFMN